MCPWYDQVNKMAILSISITRWPEIYIQVHHTKMILRAKKGVSFMSVQFYSSLEEHSIIQMEKKQLMCDKWAK